MLSVLLFRRRVAAHGASVEDEKDGWNEGGPSRDLSRDFGRIESGSRLLVSDEGTMDEKVTGWSGKNEGCGWRAQKDV